MLPRAGDTSRASSSPYLPPLQTARQEYIFRLRMRIYYRAIWLRRLHQWGDPKPDADLSVLDVGCGPGYFLSVLSEVYPQVDLVGVDIDDELLDAARQCVGDNRLVRASAQDLPFSASSFDLVFSNQVVEHLHNPTQFFREAHRILRPGGLLLFSTPNPAGLAARWLGPRWQGHRFDHVSLATPEQWRSLCSQVGFEILEEGTTALTGFKFMQRFPLSLLNEMPMSIVGFFPWGWGEAYMAIAQKTASESIVQQRLQDSTPRWNSWVLAWL